MITGITGQDGSYLAEHLQGEGYEVWGFVHGRKNPLENRTRQLIPDLRVVYGDLLDIGSIRSAIEQVQPDEVYNLAAISQVPTSWQHPELTGEVTALGVMRILESIRTYSGIADSSAQSSGQIRFYQASSSEMFGDAEDSPQTEQTSFRPRNPYGSAKVYGHFLTQHYRESYGMYAASGILYNHESPRRGRDFVSRKVSLGAASIALGYEKSLRLGTLSARRDWGFAGDYARAMRLVLCQDEPGDYVIGTGETHSVQDLAEKAFHVLGLDWREHVVCDAAFVRPAEAIELRADWTKARDILGWQPTVNFDQLVEMMVESDLRLLKDQGDIVDLDIRPDH